MVAACNSDQCFDNRNSLPLAGFYSSSPTPKQVSLDSVSVFALGAPGDSILHDSVRSLSQTYMPFLIGQGNHSVTYVIKYLAQPMGALGLEDRITFDYRATPRFVSAACGVVYDFKINSITHTGLFIDSVTCPGGTITNVAEENIKIYFRVNTENEP